eukprot:COSAG02_NODE_885_length_16178_cov_80.571677_11_plen_68_part_00
MYCCCVVRCDGLVVGVSVGVELTQHHLIAEELFPTTVHDKVGFVASTALCTLDLLPVVSQGQGRVQH